MAKLFIFLGLILLLLGLLLQFAPWALTWFGRLPGDIRYESDTVRVYIPITSMLILSLLLTLVMNLLNR